MATVHRRRFSSLEIQDIVTEYQLGSSLALIAERFHVSYKKVQAILKREGVRLRTQTEATNLFYHKDTEEYCPSEEEINKEKERIRRTWGIISEEGEDDQSGVYYPPKNTLSGVY